MRFVPDELVVDDVDADAVAIELDVVAAVLELLEMADEVNRCLVLDGGG